MKKQTMKLDRNRIANYFWLRDTFGLEGAAMFFPDIHAHFHPTKEDRNSPAEDEPHEDGEEGSG